MKTRKNTAKNPVFGLRYLEDREVEGLDIVGCAMPVGGRSSTGCDDIDSIVMV